MAKKQTNWITIPEETVHTPVSNKKGEPPVKNKLFWGVSFVVLVVVTFALLAPNQFNELLKGSLFDAPGTGNPTAGLLNGDSEPDVDALEESSDVAMEMEDVEESGDTMVVEAEDEAVEIAVEPLQEPETIEIEPVEPTAEDCGKDVDCFVEHLKDCSLAKVNYGYTFMSQSFEADLDLTGSEEENCLVNAVFTKSPLLINLNDKEANCKLEKGEYTESSLQGKFSNPDEVLNLCSGSAIDVLNEYASLLGGSMAEDEPKEDTNDQATLIEDLNAQLEQIQNQRAEDLKAMQDLVDIVQEQKEEEGLYPSAQDPSTIPTSVNSTAAIGQPAAVQPGFRINPYRVEISPEQVLQQNMNQGAQYAQQTSSAPAYQQNNYQSVPSVNQTPETGPSEVLFLAFVLTFLSLVGWKFMRTFA